MLPATPGGCGGCLNILFFDLGRRCGYAYGPVGKPPVAGSIVLRKPAEPNALALGALARWFRDHIRDIGKPDLVGIEKWLPVAASRDDDSTEDALRMNGAIHAVCGVYKLSTVEPTVNEIRMAICGKTHDKRGVGTKQMVINTLALRGLVPRDETDDNKCDAIAGWLWVEAYYGRTPR